MIAVRFPKGSSSLEVVDLGRPLKEWDSMGNRKVLEGKGTTGGWGEHKHLGRQMSRQVVTAWRDGCWAADLHNQHRVVGPRRTEPREQALQQPLPITTSALVP